VAQEDRKGGRFDDGTEAVIGVLIDVHRALGPGLLESVYEACVCKELSLRGFRYVRQEPLAVAYKGVLIDCGYRLDVVVEGTILLELKAVDRLLPIHEAQVVTYLRLGRMTVGLLVHFNSIVLRQAMRRLTPHHPKTFRPSFLPVISPREAEAVEGTGRSEDRKD
jgi:GxxExxY protein